MEWHWEKQKLVKVIEFCYSSSYLDNRRIDGCFHGLAHQERLRNQGSKGSLDGALPSINDGSDVYQYFNLPLLSNGCLRNNIAKHVDHDGHNLRFRCFVSI